VAPGGSPEGELEALRTTVDALSRRVEELEDRLAVAGIIAAYGPAVDAGSVEATADLWLDEGTYVYPLDGEDVVLSGRSAIVDMVRGEMHQSIITGGAGHVLTSPSIRIDGDTAVATCHSLLVRRTPEGGFAIDRLSANRWRLRRTDEGWRVEERVNRMLDGDAGARTMLEEGRRDARA